MYRDLNQCTSNIVANPVDNLINHIVFGCRDTQADPMYPWYIKVYYITIVHCSCINY